MTFDPVRDKIAFDPDEIRIKAAAEDRRQQLLDGHMDAMMRGSLMMERKEPYRPLSDAVMEAIIRGVREQRPRRGDPLPEYSPGFRRVLEETSRRGIARFNQAPHGDRRPGDRIAADNPRPGDILSGGYSPKVDDPSTIHFYPSTGKVCPAFWPEPPDPRLRPYPLELPGYLWPDGGVADTLPVELAMEDLRRVRWAPGRPTIFVADGAPEPV
jgi:hypothetical protein